MKRKRTGRPSDLASTYGEAWELRATAQRPDQEASLAVWLLYVPSASPAWEYYYLAVIHLRDIDGVPPAHKDWPEAEYELMVLAVDPRCRPSAERAEAHKLQFLRPGNVRVQWDSTSDEYAAGMARDAVKAILNGVLPVEPEGIVGARQLWQDAIRETADHYVDPTHGGHQGHDHAS